MKVKELENSIITFGAQMGDVSADKAVGTHVEELTDLFERYCEQTYCNEIDELAPVLRVDGELWHFDFEGCEKLRLSKKHRYITIDIGVPRSKWENVDSAQFRVYLFTQLRIAFEMMITRLKKEKYKVQEAEFWADLSKVEERFLNN